MIRKNKLIKILSSSLLFSLICPGISVSARSNKELKKEIKDEKIFESNENESNFERF